MLITKIDHQMKLHYKQLDKHIQEHIDTYYSLEKNNDHKDEYYDIIYSGKELSHDLIQLDVINKNNSVVSQKYMFKHLWNNKVNEYNKNIR
jgi:hypothetical protein